jgi:hypothetical protein
MRLISMAMTVLTLRAEPQGEASGRENYTTFAKPPFKGAHERHNRHARPLKKIPDTFCVGNFRFSCHGEFPSNQFGFARFTERGLSLAVTDTMLIQTQRGVSVFALSHFARQAALVRARRRRLAR